MDTLHTVLDEIAAGKSDLWGAILGGVIGAVIASFAAIGAGWLGARGALKAAEISAGHARDNSAARAKRAQLDAGVAFVQSIQAEVQGLWNSFSADIGPKIHTADNDGYKYANIVGHNYFVVYMANAQLLGSVSDAPLRKCIVSLYIEAMSFIDALGYNTRLVELYDESARSVALADGPLAATLQWDHSARGKRVADYLGVLRQSLQTLEVEMERFWELSNAWLAQNGAATNPPPQMGADQEPGAASEPCDMA